MTANSYVIRISPKHSVNFRLCLSEKPQKSQCITGTEKTIRVFFNTLLLVVMTKYLAKKSTYAKDVDGTEKLK